MPVSRPRPGFTLVELLVVVVIVGILAAVAVPRFTNTTAKADLATVRSDLHTLAAAQEDYYYEHGAYTPSVAVLGMHASPGVTVTIVEAGTSGWSARAVHPAAVPVTCALFSGAAKPVAPATTEGVLTCR